MAFKNYTPELHISQPLHPLLDCIPTHQNVIKLKMLIIFAFK